MKKNEKIINLIDEFTEKATYVVSFIWFTYSFISLLVR